MNAITVQIGPKPVDQLPDVKLVPWIPGDQNHFQVHVNNIDLGHVMKDDKGWYSVTRRSSVNGPYIEVPGREYTAKDLAVYMLILTSHPSPCT